MRGGFIDIGAFTARGIAVAEVGNLAGAGSSKGFGQAGLDVSAV
jgi:hypothetical protein